MDNKIVTNLQTGHETDVYEIAGDIVSSMNVLAERQAKIDSEYWEEEIEPYPEPFYEQVTARYTPLYSPAHWKEIDYAIATKLAGEW